MKFTYFGMALLALQATFSRFGVRLALYDALFRHTNAAVLDIMGASKC